MHSPRDRFDERAYHDVIAVIDRLARAFDAQDWAAARACLADEIDTDYSSFRGTPPERLGAEAYLALRQQGLAGLRTEHRNSDYTVTVEENRATCRTAFAIRRWAADAPGRFFHSFGTYSYTLRRDGTAWRITGITQVVVRTEGDPTVHGAFRPAPSGR